MISDHEPGDGPVRLLEVAVLLFVAIAVGGFVLAGITGIPDPLWPTLCAAVGLLVAAFVTHAAWERRRDRARREGR